MALILTLTALLFGLMSGTAFAGYYGKTWLNWVYTGAENYQFGAYTHLKQVQVEPSTYKWGCANLWKETYYVFSSWVCCSPGCHAETSMLGGEGVWAQPVAANKSSYDQYLWSWEYYYA